jgi:glycyl-tRNA synthetase beta chain
LADKLDSVVGMFSAGERPTGSRDPLGLRRQAQGVVKILADLPEVTGLERAPRLGVLMDRAAEPFGGHGADPAAVRAFMADRLTYLLEQRGHDVRNVRAVMHEGIDQISPLETRRTLEALSQMTGSQALVGVATLFKRVKNITKDVTVDGRELAAIRPRLVEPAEEALASALAERSPSIREAISQGRYKDAFGEIASLGPVVTTFFDDVLVMAEDADVRAARLALVAHLRDLILELADISEIVAES